MPNKFYLVLIFCLLFTYVSAYEVSCTIRASGSKNIRNSCHMVCASDHVITDVRQRGERQGIHPWDTSISYRNPSTVEVSTRFHTTWVAECQRVA